MRYLYGFLILTSIVLLGSCRKDFDTVPSSGKLEFSADTIYLDTIFSGIGSSTYNLKVYNRSDEDIRIPSIRLGQGESSHYRLNVDGIPGKTFQNIDVLAKDSIFVFVETTASITDLTSTEVQFLYTDAIEFDIGSNQQKVELVTLVQDAVFLFPERFSDGTTERLSLGFDEEGNELFIEGFFLEGAELHFTDEKPYVIYGYAAVPSGETLSIDAGARVHFHEGSGIIVAENASLHVNGEVSADPVLLEKEVIFEGDRLEPGYSDVPGQWGRIWLTAGSTNHIINHATIKNATVGIQMDSNDGGTTPTLTIKNTQIYNSNLVGLYSLTGNIYGENLVINNSGLSSLNLSLGGTYEFVHCTFANYWRNGFRQFPSVLVSNQLETPDEVFISDLSASFTNCIIYGNENIELVLDKEDGVAFDYHFKNSLIRFRDFNENFEDNPLYDFENPVIFDGNVFNEDPDFLDPLKNQLNIGEESAANALAVPGLVGEDILGNPRTSEPDSGAYESIVFPEE